MRQEDEQRQEEESLPREGEHEPRSHTADRREVVDGERLDAADADHHQIDAQIFFGKVKIELRSAAEDGGDLAWKELKDQKDCHAQKQRKNKPLAIGLLDAPVVPRPHIKAEDRLTPLRKTDGKGDQHTVELRDNPRHSERNIRAVDARHAVVREDIVERNADGHHDDLIQKIRQTQFGDTEHLTPPHPQHGTHDGKCLKAEEITNTYEE